MRVFSARQGVWYFNGSKDFSSSVFVPWRTIASRWSPKVLGHAAASWWSLKSAPKFVFLHAGKDNMSNEQLWFSSSGTVLTFWQVEVGAARSKGASLLGRQGSPDVVRTNSQGNFPRKPVTRSESCWSSMRQLTPFTINLITTSSHCTANNACQFYCCGNKQGDPSNFQHE